MHFHNCLIKIKSDPVYSQLSKRHGRFTPKNMYSKDQLKCPFSMDVGLTYADTGSTEVLILQLALGMDKRLCTLHIMFWCLVMFKELTKVSEPDL